MIVARLFLVISCFVCSTGHEHVRGQKTRNFDITCAPHEMVQFDEFTFGKGGHMFVKAKGYDNGYPGGAYILICSGPEELNSVPDDIEAVCSDIGQFRATTTCLFMDEVPRGNSTSLELKHKVSGRIRYMFNGLNCGDNDAHLMLQVSLKNHGGEFLSLYDIPLKKLPGIFAVIWVGLLAIWCSNWIVYRDRSNTSLQRYLTMVPVFSVLRLALAMYFWHEKSKEVSVPPVLEISMLLVTAVWRTICLLWVAVLSFGWRLTVVDLLPQEECAVKIISIAFFFLEVEWLAFRTFLNFAVLLFYSIVIYNYLLRVVDVNIHNLEVEVLNTRLSDVPLTTLPDQLTMFRSLSPAVSTFAILRVVSLLWSLPEQLNEEPLMGFGLDEASDLIAALWIGYIFRARPVFPAYYIPIFRVPIPSPSPGGGGGGSEGEGQPLLSRSGSSRFTSLMAPGHTSRGALAIVLVENPPNVSPSGRLIPNYGVGTAVQSPGRKN